MQPFAKTILVLLAATALLALSSLGAGQVENRPAENAMENLFNKGIGHAWVGGEPFSSSTETGGVQMQNAKCAPDYSIIGFLNVTSGLIVASDSMSMRFNPGPGNYPVYGYFQADKLTGIFIDFESSS
jgi:hypothetical protein